MTDSPKDLTPQQRKKRNDELKTKAEARLKARGAPFFGATEKDILDIKVQIPQITQSINAAVKDIHKLAEDIAKLSDSIHEQKLINETLRDLLVSKQIISATDVSDTVESRQLAKLGLTPKAGDDIAVEADDHVLMKFKVMHDGKVVDDKTSGLMAYHVGTNGIPCDPEMIGMKEKETKTFSMISQFKNKELKDYYGKEIEMEIFISKILQKDAGKA